MLVMLDNVVGGGGLDVERAREGERRERKDEI